jgi:RNA polymerase sigma-70 factor (family 1)
MENDPHIYEESRLIALLSNDSEYAFQLIYNRQSNRIYQTAVRYLKSPLLAQDVVQDVFLKLWTERKQLKPKLLPIDAWLYTVAKNNILNRIKKIAHDWKAAGNLRFILPQIIDNTDDKIKNAQYTELLRKAIEALPAQQRKIFSLAREEQLTYQQIGEKTGISPLTVKTHMSRALQHIREYFLANGEVLLCVVLFLIR